MSLNINELVMLMSRCELIRKHKVNAVFKYKNKGFFDYLMFLIFEKL